MKVRVLNFEKIKIIYAQYGIKFIKNDTSILLPSGHTYSSDDERNSAGRIVDVQEEYMSNAEWTDVIKNVKWYGFYEIDNAIERKAVLPEVVLITLLSEKLDKLLEE